MLMDDMLLDDDLDLGDDMDMDFGDEEDPE